VFVLQLEGLPPEGVLPPVYSLEPSEPTQVPLLQVPP
jgi:hypothetical protein